ncbi:MAG: SMI1/KNR4 family protein [Acidobacteriota bacterium]
MGLDDIYNYFRAYDKDTFGVFACQGSEPSEADIAAFERVCGFRLPEEFREFTKSSLGGLYMEAREQFWPRPKAYDVGPFWSFLYGVKVFGIAADIPEWLDLRVQHRAMGDDGYPHLVPFLQVQGDANRYCFDARGRVIYWDHEEPDEEKEVALSFSDLLLREIHDLEDRTGRKKRGEDKQGGA